MWIPARFPALNFSGKCCFFSFFFFFPVPKRMDRRESLGGRSTADGTGWVASISDRIRGASCSSRDKAEPSVLCRKKKKNSFGGRDQPRATKPRRPEPNLIQRVGSDMQVGEEVPTTSQADQVGGEEAAIVMLKGEDQGDLVGSGAALPTSHQQDQPARQHQHKRKSRAAEVSLPRTRVQTLASEVTSTAPNADTLFAISRSAELFLEALIARVSECAPHWASSTMPVVARPEDDKGAAEGDTASPPGRQINVQYDEIAATVAEDRRLSSFLSDVVPVRCALGVAFPRDDIVPEPATVAKEEEEEVKEAKDAGDAMEVDVQTVGAEEEGAAAPHGNATTGAVQTA